MADIIDLEKRRDPYPGKLITEKPLEFRRAVWDSSFFIQVLRSLALKFEESRTSRLGKGEYGTRNLPPHYSISGGMAYTIKALYLFRDNKEKMVETYYLAGLIDCMINQISPLLRTNLISDMYKKINLLKKILGVTWYGRIDQVLFPIETPFFNLLEYRANLSEAKDMRELYSLIRSGTTEMFHILSMEYIFYTPGRGG